MSIQTLLNTLLDGAKTLQQDSLNSQNSILNQVIEKGRQSFDSKSLLNNPDLIKYGKGAAVGGLLGLLLGGKKRKLGKSVLKMGSLAAVGALAYRAYQNSQFATQSTTHSSMPAYIPSAEQGNDKQEQNSRVLLMAMIAAANADGVISADERATLLEQIAGESAADQIFLTALIESPPSANAVAHAIGEDMALKSEAYLLSCMICGEIDAQEADYLHNLQQALNLPDELSNALSAQAG